MKRNRRVGLLVFIYCIVRREHVDTEELWLLFSAIMWVGYFVFWAPWDKDEQEIVRRK